MEDRQLTVTNGKFPSPVIWQQMTSMAEHLVKSNAIPSSIKNQAQLAMVLLAGMEAGLGAMESLGSYYIVNGKITIYGQTTLSQLKRAGYKVRWGDCTEKKAEVTIIHPDETESKEVYTWEEAVKTGQTTKDPWVKHTKTMLRWKALAQNIRFNCPEVLNGHYIKEDFDGTADNEAINARNIETKEDEIKEEEGEEIIKE